MATRNSEEPFKIYPENKGGSVRRINEQNTQFWLEQNTLRDRRMSDMLLFKIASDEMRSESSRGVAIKAQKSLEQALADAETTQKLVRSDFSRKGGRIRKRDSLQDLILEMASKNPAITSGQLLGKLKDEEGEGIVSSVDCASSVLAGDARNIHFF